MGYTPPQLEVRKITGGWSISPPNATTTDDLTIYPNTTDTKANIVIQGNAGINLTVSGDGDIYRFYNSTTERMRIYYSTPDQVIKSMVADKNLFLETAGTGVIKFGTYTAGAATDSTGYITILDAAGNTRKLMVQA